MKHLKRIGLIIASIVFSTAQLNASSDQYISMLYSEVLGREPDINGYSNMVDLISIYGCTQTNIKNIGSAFFTSTEFGNLNYSNEETVFLLYKAVLIREPDQSGFSYWVSQLSNGSLTVGELANLFYTSTEFINNVFPKICSPNPTGTIGNATFSMSVANPGDFNGGTGAQLQAALNALAGTNGTLTLGQRAVVTVSSTIKIPDGVTLKTANATNRNAYAKMGRLVRTSNFNTPMIELGHGSKLDFVWIDGNRRSVGYSLFAQNLFAVSNTQSNPTRISFCRFSDTAGWTNIQVINDHASNNNHWYSTITNNLITCYNSIDYRFSPNPNARWCDGISSESNNATVQYNAIIDATDVGIVIFRPLNSITQQNSKIRYNTVINTSNIIFAGIATEVGSSILSGQGAFTNPIDFSGTAISNNFLWTSESSHQQIGIMVGTRIWGTNRRYGKGATVSNNTFGSSSFPATFGIGIAVSGMSEATISNNALNTIIDQSLTHCQYGNIVVDESEAFINPTVDTTYTEGNLVACLKELN